MKFSHILISVTLTLASIVAGCTSPDSLQVAATMERIVELPLGTEYLFGPANAWTLYIKRGDTRDDVLIACGRPTTVINRNLWVYRSGYSSSEAARQAGCDTLLVAFVSERVADLKLVNGDVLKSELAKRSKMLQEARTSARGPG